jgi:hypothetical protein
MKNLIALGVALALAGCVTIPPGATALNGSRDKGMVVVAWQATPFKGLQDYHTPMLQVALSTCQAWGYHSATQFGLDYIQYGAGIHGVTPYFVKTAYQCVTGSAPQQS